MPVSAPVQLAEMPTHCSESELRSKLSFSQQGGRGRKSVTRQRRTAGAPDLPDPINAFMSLNFVASSFFLFFLSDYNVNHAYTQVEVNISLNSLWHQSSSRWHCLRYGCFWIIFFLNCHLINQGFFFAVAVLLNNAKYQKSENIFEEHF